MASRGVSHAASGFGDAGRGPVLRLELQWGHASRRMFCGAAALQGADLVGLRPTSPDAGGTKEKPKLSQSVM